MNKNPERSIDLNSFYSTALTLKLSTVSGFRGNRKCEITFLLEWPFVRLFIDSLFYETFVGYTVVLASAAAVSPMSLLTEPWFSG